MINYSETIPFNPGFSNFAQDIPFDILEQIEMLKKNTPKHKIKFELSRTIPLLAKNINAISSIYAGCMTWGVFLNLYFKDNPLKITENPVLLLSDKEKALLDYAEESSFMLNLINSLDKDSKFFLNKPLDIHPKVVRVLEAYADFARLNNNFINTFLTSDIEFIDFLQKYKSYSKEELESLHDKIKLAIRNNKIIDLLETV